MRVFQAYCKGADKYLHEMRELFGGWNRKKGPKRFYTRPADARSALSNVVYDQPKDYVFDPSDWEIHEFDIRKVGSEPFKK